MNYSFLLVPVVLLLPAIWDFRYQEVNRDIVLTSIAIFAAGFILFQVPLWYLAFLFAALIAAFFWSNQRRALQPVDWVFIGLMVALSPFASAVAALLAAGICLAVIYKSDRTLPYLAVLFLVSLLLCIPYMLALMY